MSVLSWMDAPAHIHTWRPEVDITFPFLLLSTLAFKLYIFVGGCLPACMSVHHFHDWCPWRPEGGIWSPSSGVKMTVSHHWVLELNTLEEQSVLLTALSPARYFSFWNTSLTEPGAHQSARLASQRVLVQYCSSIGVANDTGTEGTGSDHRASWLCTGTLLTEPSLQPYFDGF